eukprot:m51a1_g84 putative C-tail anchored protein, putative Nicastrin domain (652) ;mRNA; f:271616-274170
MRIALIVVCALAFLVEANQRHLGPGSLRSRMYEPISGFPCVRLLNASRQIGCSQIHGIVSGALQLLETDEDVSAFAKHAPFGNTVVLLNSTLFTRSVIDRLRKTSNLAGVAVMRESGISSAQSPDSKRPNSKFGLPSVKFDWNPSGDDFMWQDYRFPIWLIPANASATLKQRALSNKQKNSFPRWGMSLRTKMSASKDSVTCLRRSQCLPIGSQSVWGSLGAFNMSKPIVLATSTLDSASFFHDASPGADAHLSGVIALLAAHVSLSKVDLSAAPNQLAFAYFQGESWDNMGSRKFADDIANFKCDKVNKAKPEQCDRPFALSTAFTGINSTNLLAVIDVSQVSLNNGENPPTVYVHRMTDTPRSVADWIQNTGIHMTNLSVSSVDPNAEVGVPPSPAISFYRSFKTPIVVLAEHKAEFTNQYYHSHMDTQISNPDKLCLVSTLVARSLYSAARNVVDDSVENITVDCQLVKDLAYCLTVNFKCPLIEKYLGNLSTPEGNELRMTYYVGVYGSEYTNPSVHPASYFVREFLTDNTAYDRKGNCTGKNECDEGYECVGASPNTTCVKAHVHYHVAIPLGIGWSYGDSSWYVKDESESSWTESYWGSLSAEVFLMDDPKNDLAILLSGLALLGVSVVTTFVCRRTLSKHYKLA